MKHFNSKQFKKWKTNFFFIVPPYKHPAHHFSPLPFFGNVFLSFLRLSLLLLHTLPHDINTVFLRELTGYSKHPLPTTQEKILHMDITDGQHRNQIDYIFCSQRWRSSIQSAKTRPRADYGSDHELLIPNSDLN